MVSYTINWCGLKHTHNNKPCEDAVSISNDGRVFCLADGVSSCPNGRQGAEAYTSSVQDWLAKSEVQSGFTKLAAAEIRTFVADKITGIGERLCEKFHSNDPGDFAATLLCAVELSETTMCLIHCGDGMIFALPSGEGARPVILSMPDNSPNGAVFEAGCPEQRKRMRILRVYKEDYAQILLGTDGFTDAYFRYPAFSRMDLLERLFSTQTQADFISMAKEQHQEVADDISCIRIWTTGSPRATMSAEPDVMDEETAADRAERCPEPIQPQEAPQSVRLRTAPEAPGPAIPPSPMGDAPVRRHSKSGAAKKSAAARRARKNLLYRLMAAAAVLAVFGMTVAFIATTLVRLHRLETATRAQAEIISNLDLSGAQRDRNGVPSVVFHTIMPTP